MVIEQLIRQSSMNPGVDGSMNHCIKIGAVLNRSIRCFLHEDNCHHTRIYVAVQLKFFLLSVYVNVCRCLLARQHVHKLCLFVCRTWQRSTRKHCSC